MTNHAEDGRRATLHIIDLGYAKAVFADDACYFNTTWREGAELTQSQHAAEEQNARVLRIMREAGRPMIPWEVHALGAAEGCGWLITSVRRSMCVLSDGEGAPLVKLDTLRPGPHGKPSHEWCVAECTASRQAVESVNHPDDSF